MTVAAPPCAQHNDIGFFGNNFGRTVNGDDCLMAAEKNEAGKQQYYYKKTAFFASRAFTIRAFAIFQVLC